MRYIVHFSCGAASAVSALLVLMKYGRKNVELLYTDPGLEHEDNHRFMADFEALIGVKVTKIKHKKYNNPFEIFEERKFLAGIAGAPCTTELKKNTARDYLGPRLYDEVNIFGFDCSKSEQSRANRYQTNNPLLKVSFPLIENDISKTGCFYILDKIGLKLPYMYKLGYRNSNCTGCVKASSLGYWAAIRHDFPDIFKWYAEFERKIGAKDEFGIPRGAAINKRYVDGERERVFLDEIPPDFPIKRNISFTCGYTCGAQDMEVEAVAKLTKEPSLVEFMVYDKINNWLTNN